MIDLRLLYKTNYESVTKALAGRGVGGFFGSVIGGLLVDKFSDKLELCCAVGTTIAGGSVAAVTYLRSIDHVWLLYVLIGACSSIVNMGNYRKQSWSMKNQCNDLFYSKFVGISSWIKFNIICC